MRQALLSVSNLNPEYQRVARASKIIRKHDNEQVEDPTTLKIFSMHEDSAFRGNCADDAAAAHVLRLETSKLPSLDAGCAHEDVVVLEEFCRGETLKPPQECVPNPAALILKKRRLEFLPRSTFVAPELLKWLSCDTIDWGQSRLQRKFPSVRGLQSTLSNLTVRRGADFAPVDIADFVVQALNLDNHHWVLSGQKEGEVFYIDTLNPDEVPQSILLQMQRIYPREGPLNVSIVRVKQQEDFVSCGVFVLAEAYLLASKTLSPEELSCTTLNAERLWRWLITCWSNDDLTKPPFELHAAHAKIHKVQCPQLPSKEYLYN